MANFSKTFESDLRNEFSSADQIHIAYEDGICNDVDPSEAVEFALTVINFEGETIWERFKLPKRKEVDLEWIMSKLNKDKVYESFVENFKELLEGIEIEEKFSVYPTTYGIGLHVMFSREPRKLMETISSELSKKNIEHHTEYSDAHYVFRFVISKSSENIERMSNV